MVQYIKNLLVNILWVVACRKNKEVCLQGWRKKVYLARLYKEDIPRWRVEVARSKGVKVGNNCRLYSMNFFTEPNLVEIGDDVIVSGEVKFITHDGAIYLIKDEIPNLRGNYGRIKIGNNCFIGMGAIICQNVEIGNNSIIAAGAVVMDSFPDDSVIMGNPAKAVFKFDMYRKMKKNSPFTLTHDVYPFPLRISTKDRAELVAEHIANLPIKKAKRCA